MSDTILKGDPNTLRILELDGGGMRGYLSIQFLKNFVEEWGINSNEIWKYFDVICGTSIGGIMALGLAAGKSIEDIEEFFTEKGEYIFTLGLPVATETGIIVPGIRPNLAQKGALILNNEPFYDSKDLLGVTHDNYGAQLLYSTIRDLLDPLTLSDLKTNVIIPSVQLDYSNTETVKYTFVTFSNIDHPEFIGQNALASDVASATSAAPVYLPKYSFANDTEGVIQYIDGGVYQNNPASFGRNIAQIIKPTKRRTCILSVGTGIGAVGFNETGTVPPPQDPPPENPPITMTITKEPSFHVLRKKALPREDEADNAPSSIDLIMQLFTLASTGGQESVARSLFLEAEYGGTQLYYYRFQPKLDPSQNTELDNSDEDILQYYRDTAQTWFDDPVEEIKRINFLGHLTA